MSALTFVSEIVSPHTTVLVTGVHQPIASEICSLLRPSQHFKVVEITDANMQIFPQIDVNLVIHVAGFDKASLAQTLYHTSTLHRLMDFALAHRAKFILVLAEDPTAVQQTAISLAQQFGKNFHLNYQIVTVPSDLPKSVAALEVIRTFSKGFQVFLPENPPAVPCRSERKLLRHLKLLFIFPAILLIFTLGQLVVLGFSLDCGYQNLMRQRWSVAQTCSKIAGSFSAGLNYETRGLSVQQIFITTSQIASTIHLLSQVGESANIEQLHKLNSLLPIASEQLAYLEANLQRFSYTKKWLPKIDETRGLITKAQLVLPEVEKISKVSNQTWLILIQDAKELRPSGGFLGNIALASLEKGQMTDIQFYETETTDELLRGHVEPPQDLKTVTRQSNWYLRDSNWDLDFPASAAKASWFVNKELGQKVDGVVGLNSNLGQKINFILDVSGDIFGSQTMDKLKTATLTQKQQIWQEIIQALMNRELLIASDQAAVSLSAVKWDGALAADECRQQNCLSDLIYIVDSNVGVNKVNPKINSNYRLELLFSATKLQYIYNLVYSNTSTTQAWPEGDYTNYLRFVTAPGVIVDQVLVVGKPVNIVSSVRVDGTEIHGLLLNIPITQTKTVTIMAHRPLKENLSQYQLSWLNQPGQSAVPVELAVSFPSDKKVQSFTPLTVASMGRFGYNTLLNKPYTIGLSF